MVFQNAIDNLVELLCVLSPVYFHAVLLSCGSKLVEIFIQMRDGVALDGAGLLAQLLPFVEPVCHIVTLRTDSPECGIVPMRILLVL